MDQQLVKFTHATFKDKDTKNFVDIYIVRSQIFCFYHVPSMGHVHIFSTAGGYAPVQESVEQIKTILEEKQNGTT